MLQEIRTGKGIHHDLSLVRDKQRAFIRVPISVSEGFSSLFKSSKNDKHKKSEFCKGYHINEYGSWRTILSYYLTANRVMVCYYSRTSMTRTSLKLCKYVLDRVVQAKEC